MYAKFENSLTLFVTSALLLFVEVMAIRWFSIEFPLVRVFPNLVLTTIFIGISAGLATYQQPYLSTLLTSIVVLTSLFFLVFAEPLHLHELSLQSPLQTILSLLFVGFIVVNLTIIFVNLGRLLGQAFSKFAPLHAYSLNLLGSILGVFLFGLISWFCFLPAVWLGIATILTYVLVRKPYVLAAGAALVVVTTFMHTNSTWTPYGKIQLLFRDELNVTNLGSGNYTLNCNNGFFHGAIRILPYSSPEETQRQYKSGTKIDYHYRLWLEIPFLISQAWDEVAVMGAGSGNDVACALQHGARHVDVVDRESFFIQCGKKVHPNKPYLDPRVSTHVTDARTFLRSCNKKYDLIQFAYLDPGTCLKISSFLRSDNFVYTKESLRSALKHLTNRGTISLSFATDKDSPVTRRLYKTIKEACGYAPVALVNPTSCFFFFGPGVKTLPPYILEPAELHYWPRKGEYINERDATDDWPFLYLDQTAAGAAWIYFFVIIIASLIPLSVLRKGIANNIDKSQAWSMFFLGTAFMLVETKSITQLSLLFGATWIVSSVVITIILVLACLANLLVERFKITNPALCYLGLAVTLLIDYFFQVPESSKVSPIVLSLVAALISCAPIFFGGMIFSILFRKATNSVLLLAANILGVAFGSLAENMCIFAGIKILSLLALVLYLISAVPLISRVNARTKTP